MKPLQLNDCSNLFKDEKAYQEFVRLLTESVTTDELRVVFADSGLVCAVMGPSAIRELMRHRILKRFADQPDLLDELRDRIQEDDLVD